MCDDGIGTQSLIFGDLIGILLNFEGAGGETGGDMTHGTGENRSCSLVSKFSLLSSLSSILVRCSLFSRNDACHANHLSFLLTAGTIETSVTRLSVVDTSVADPSVGVGDRGGLGGDLIWAVNCNELCR